MNRRLCSYCGRPLGRFAKLLLQWTCGDCAYRMSMGGSPCRHIDADTTVRSGETA